MKRLLRPLVSWGLVLFTALVLSACAQPLGVVAGTPSAGRALATNHPGFTANVMAPLFVTDWTTFESQLQTAKAYGVDAVSVDVWWGDVESTADNSFNWSYYDTMFQKIKAKGLKIVPILSFHQCGGNVGDTYTSLLPSWLWPKYTGQTLNGVTLDANGLKHKSEQGNYSSETVQGWADTLVLNEYQDFTAAFVTRYGVTYASDLQEVNVSLGPAGELRYPSYNSHDSGTGYPTRGALQMYSPLAVKDFQTKMIAKYGTLAGVNTAWGTSLTSTTQIQPPSNASTFFSSGDYKNITYGRDLIDWYNQSLVDHGKRMVDTVVAALGSSFPAAKVGYKIPGIHWAMTNPTYPRAAEVAAGLIQTSIDFTADATGHGYQKIVNLANQFAGGRSVVLHFTCLEMDDQNYSPQYSLAKTLVFWVAQNAAAQGVTIKGENALSGGITGDSGWNNINNAFDNASYLGFTALRVGEVASGTGQTRYSQFIAKYRPVSGWTTLYLRGTNNGWTTSTPMTKSGDVWSVNNVAFGAASGQAFKFDVYGDWTLNYGGTALSGTAVQGGGNIPVSSNTSYNVTFNEVTKAYAASPVSSATLTLKMTKDVGSGNAMFFTGSIPALTNWGTGVQGTWTTGNVWTVTISDPGTAFEWKVRKGVTGGAGNQWESGTNHNQANLWPTFNGGF